MTTQLLSLSEYSVDFDIVHNDAVHLTLDNLNIQFVKTLNSVLISVKHLDYYSSWVLGLLLVTRE